MNNDHLKPVILTIPTFAECTLLPLTILPKHLRIYEKLFAKATELDLKELPPISHQNIQEIFKAIAYKLAEREIEITTGITIWLSGVHNAYPLLDIADKNQIPEKCITVMEIFLWDEITITEKEGISSGTVDMTLEEMPVTELWEIDGDDVVYSLFLGI